MHSATKLLMACALFALGGCGNYGNLTIDDSVYLKALPSSQDLKYDVPQGTGQPACALGQSKIATDTRNLAVQLSQNVVGFLGVIDFIKALPPSQRDTNSRTWGPWPDTDHPGVNVLVKMTRVSEDPRYTIEIEQQPRGGGAFITVVTGEFVGAVAHQGQGSLHFDYAASVRAGTSKAGDPTSGSLTIDYDFTSDPRTIHIVTAGVPTPIDVALASYLDGQVRVDLNYTDTATGAQIITTSKFNSKGEGLANWSLKAGNKADTAKECWNALYCRTYLNDLAGWTTPPCTGAFCVLGDAASCPAGLH